MESGFKQPALRERSSSHHQGSFHRHATYHALSTWIGTSNFLSVWVRSKEYYPDV